jgi:hypothetical protein
MKRPARERVPALVGWAAPASWWLPAVLVGALAGAVAAGFGGPDWLIAVGGGLLGWVVDAHWRRTRPPSEDAKWTPLARLFYRRVERR